MTTLILENINVIDAITTTNGAGETSIAVAARFGHGPVLSLLCKTLAIRVEKEEREAEEENAARQGLGHLLPQK